MGGSSVNTTSNNIGYHFSYTNNGTCPTRYSFASGIYHQRAPSGSPDFTCYFTGSLNVGGAIPCDGNIKDNSYGSGTSYAVIDVNNNVIESNESDNQTSRSVCVPDVYEDNDDDASAYPLNTIDNTTRVVLATLTNGDIKDVFTAYFIDNSIGDNLDITLTSTPYTSYRVELYNSSGTPCHQWGSPCSGNGTQAIHWDGTWGNDTGTYIIVIYSTSSSLYSCDDSYQLNITEGM